MKNITLSVIIALSTSAALPAVAQSTSNVTQVSTSTGQYSDAELDSVLAPIALYPDTLLTHILIAATYPLDVVSADRWRQSNKHLTPEQVENALANVQWDASVKALASFTDLLNTMANDLQWLQQLGDNVLIDQSRVLDRVQVLRQHALNTGNLVTNDYIEVERERERSREIIYIEPRQREVVYVPYYDPHIVYGHWWHASTPVHWRHHVSYHHHSNVFWSPRIRLSTFFFFGSVHWHNRHVVIHREPVRRYYHGSPRKRVISRDYRRWEHSSVHRRARYSNRVIHSAPARYEHVGVTRASQGLTKRTTLSSSSPHRVDSVNRVKTSRTIARKEVTPLRENRLQNTQGTVKRKQSIEHALKRNQTVVRNSRPTKENTLKQLQRTNQSKVSSTSKSIQHGEQKARISRAPKHDYSKKRIEKTSPQKREYSQFNSKPKRVERAGDLSAGKVRANSTRTVKQTRSDKSQRQVSRIERRVSKANSY
ncbi:DUF3300 domain-containing protein [Alteromonas gracilis]|uniref:DUF3300 domain-containing protein n=1 Tax=Alteromonas gracilis TaxID=1479524 RepID=UPI003735ECFE